VANRAVATGNGVQLREQQSLIARHLPLLVDREVDKVNVLDHGSNQGGEDIVASWVLWSSRTFMVMCEIFSAHNGSDDFRLFVVPA
jgi:hypothetical protein